MYLYKHPNSVYYTRICTPKKLAKLGFPFDFKISLRTKSRPTALRRNLATAPIVVQSLDKMPLDREFSSEYLGQFKSELKKHIEESWSSLSNHLDFNSSSLANTARKATMTPKEKSNGAPKLLRFRVDQ